MAARPHEAGTGPTAASGAAASASPDNDESYMEELGNRLAGEPPRPRIPAPGAQVAPRPVRVLPRNGRTLPPGGVPAPIAPPGKSALPPAPAAPAKKLTLPPAPRPIPPAALAVPSISAAAPPPPPRREELASTRDEKPSRGHEGPTDRDPFDQGAFDLGSDSDLPPPTGDLDPDETSDLLPRGVQVMRPYEDSQFQIVAPESLPYQGDPFTMVPDAPEMRGKKRDPIDDETEIDNDNFVAEEATSILHEQPAAPMLWVEKGKDTGKEFTIAEGETCVGRGIDNDIILTDIAISRRHLRIERDGDRVVLFDLGSGNGSTVNGGKHAKIELAHGDRIGLGTTVLVVRWPESVARTPDEVEAEPTRMSRGAEPTPLVQVDGGRPAPSGDSVGTPTGTVDPGPAARPRPAAPARERTSSSRAFWIVGAGLAAVLLIGLGAVSAVAIARVLSNGQEAETQMALATSSVSARRWTEAETQLRKVLEIDPEHVLATEYLGRVQREQQAESALARGRAALANGDASSAITEASSVRLDSLYVDEARALRAQAVTRRTDELLLAVEGALARNDRALARAKLDEALRLDPQNARAIAMGPVVSGVSGAVLPPPAAPSPPVAPSPVTPSPVAPSPVAPAIPTPPIAVAPSPPPVAPPVRVTPSAPVAAAPTRSTSGERDTPSSPTSRGAERGSERGAERTTTTPARAGATGSTSRAVSLYRSGNFDSAAEAARAAGDAAMAQRIERFAGHWGRIQRAGGNWGSVARDLETANRLDNQISGGSAYGGRLRGLLVSYYIGQARSSLSAGQYHTACPKVRAILGLDRNNSTARQMSQQCEQRATQLLSRASAMERSNAAGARALYRQILLMVPSGTSIHQQAYQRIRALPQTGPVDEDE